MLHVIGWQTQILRLKTQVAKKPVEITQNRTGVLARQWGRGSLPQKCVDI
jgi:hypothetical protein